MRKALVVGVNHYPHLGNLYGCVNDAHAVRAILERNGDGTPNFDCKLLVGSSDVDPVLRSALREGIRELFDGDSEIALLYFAGHGHFEAPGGYIISSDATSFDMGITLNEVLSFANRSRARNRIVVLDSCHSGSAGNSTISEKYSEISEGTTILSAATVDQYASEQNGTGVFTQLFVDALSGAASNIVGHITPGSIYAHIDQSLGPWDQRPVFKTNVKSFVLLRRMEPSVSFAELRRILDFFPRPGEIYSLDPSFEPERQAGDTRYPPPDPLKTAIFSVLQKFNRVGLLVPVDAPHMWHAAMESKGCRLTVLGEHYRRLVEKKRI